MKQFVQSSLVLAVSLFLLTTASIAQEFRASITGEITDQSGAAVGQARVVVTSVERNTATPTESNAAGLYNVQFLPPGPYTVTVEKEGFKKFLREGITLSSADRLRLDIRLELGAVADSVTVTGEASVLQTESASRSATIENRAIEDVPTNGRNLYQLQYTVPGVVKASTYWGSMELYAFGNVNGVIISGGKQGENETLVDGSSNTRGDRGVAWVPALNAVQEFTIRTNNYDAAYGRVGGGVTTITLKSGTNSFHGQLFEFIKNDALNANGWGANTFPDLVDEQGNAKRVPFKQHTFGFTVDAPVYIPKVFDGRNKLFWMLSLEGLRERNPGAQVTTIPQPEQLQGDFSKLFNSSGALVSIYDPKSTALGAGGRYLRTPYAGNRIPANLVNPVASKVASYYPAPTGPGTGLDHLANYVKVQPSKNGYDAWVGKMDYHVSQKSILSWRYAQTPWTNFSQIVWGTNPAEPSGEAPSTRVSRNWGADWTYTLNPSMVFNFRFGLARYEGFGGNVYAAGFDPKQLGFPASLVSQFTALQFPRFNVGGDYSPLGANTVTSYETHDNWSLQPNLSQTMGRHFLKYGAEFRRYNRNQLQPGAASGAYSFSRAWTQQDALRGDAVSGNEFASFLLGYPSGGSVVNNMDPAWRNPYYAFFVQDDWKVNNKLTINIGLRWDYEAPQFERYNRMVRRFDTTVASPIASKVQGLTLKGGLVYAGVGGESQYAFNTDKNNFQPRVGIAYRITPKWVLRAGYGLTYLGAFAPGPQTGYSQTTTMITTTDGNLTPAANLSDPFPVSLFPNGLLKPVGNSLGLSTNLGLGVSGNFVDRPLPYSHQYSVGFQRELFGNWLLDASYVGNITKGMPFGASMNFIPLAELTKLPVAERAAYFTAQVDNPMAGLLPGSSLNGAKVPRQVLLYAYPQYTGVSQASVPIARQRSDQAQFKATKRFSRGMAAQVAYTISKTYEWVNQMNVQDTNLGDLLSSGLEKRLIEFDTPQNLSVVFSYELPFGKGKQFMNDAHPVVNGIFGGWNLNWQWMRQSGFPVEMPTNAPLEPRSAKLTDAQRNANAQKAGREQFDVLYDKWYDTTLFPKQAQAAYTLRTWGTRFPDVRFKHMDQSEVSVYKQFPIKEQVKIQFRADMQNAFNHPFFNRIQSSDVTNSRFGQLRPEDRNEARKIVLVMKLIW